MIDDYDEIIHPPAATIFAMLMLSIIMCVDAVIDTYITQTLVDPHSFFIIWYPLASAVAALFWGYYIDKYGRKKLLVKSLFMTGGALFISMLIPSSWSLLNHIIKTLIAVLKGHFIIGKVLVSEICLREKRPWAISLAFGFQALGHEYAHDFYKESYPWLTELIFAAINLAMAAITNVEFEETLVKNMPTNRMQKMNIETPLYSDISKISFGQLGNDDMKLELEMNTTDESNSRIEFNLPTLDENTGEEEKDANKGTNSTQVENQANTTPVPEPTKQAITPEQQNQGANNENKPKTQPEEFNIHNFLSETKQGILDLRKDSKDLIKEYKQIFIGFNVYRLTAIFVIIFSLGSVIKEFLAGWISAPEDIGGLELIYESATAGQTTAKLCILIIQVFLYPIYSPQLNDYHVLCFLHGMLAFTFLLLPIGHSLADSTMAWFNAGFLLWETLKIMVMFSIVCVIQRFSNDILPSKKRGKFSGFQVALIYILTKIVPNFYDSLFPMGGTDAPFIPYWLWILAFIFTGFGLLFLTSRLEFYDRDKNRIKGEMNIDAEQS